MKNVFSKREDIMKERNVLGHVHQMKSLVLNVKYCWDILRSQ